MPGHGPAPLYVWLPKDVRDFVERIAEKERIPAKHVVARALALGVGLEWRLPQNTPLRSGYEPLLVDRKRPNQVYVYAEYRVLERVRSAAVLNGKATSRFAAERICAQLGVRFMPPTMGRPVVRTAEDRRRQHRDQAARRYERRHDEINERRRAANLTPEQRERRNARAREYNRERRRRLKAEASSAEW